MKKYLLTFFCTILGSCVFLHGYKRLCTMAYNTRFGSIAKRITPPFSKVTYTYNPAQRKRCFVYISDQEKETILSLLKAYKDEEPITQAITSIDNGKTFQYFMRDVLQAFTNKKSQPTIGDARTLLNQKHES